MKAELETIGFVKNKRKSFLPGEQAKSKVVVENKYLKGLIGLEGFSHAIVVFHFDKSNDVRLQVHPRSNPNLPLVGVFATRSPFRPGKIGTTVAKIEKIRGNSIFFDGLDAVDGTPVIDIKPLIPERDCPRKAKVPIWLKKESK